MIRIELARAAHGRVWLLVLLAQGAVCAVMTGPVLAPTGIDVNAWDVALEAVSGSIVATSLLVSVALVTARSWFDLDAPGVDMLIATRVGSVRRWSARLSICLAVGVVCSLLFTVLAVIAGSLHEPFAWVWSEWGQLDYSPLGSIAEQARPLSRPLPTSPVAAFLVIATFQGLAVGLLVAAIGAAIQGAGRPWLVPAGAIGLGLAGSFTEFGPLNPAAAVMWSARFPSPDGRLLWSVSTAVLLTILILTVVGGIHSTRRLPWSG